MPQALEGEDTAGPAGLEETEQGVETESASGEQAPVGVGRGRREEYTGGGARREGAHGIMYRAMKSLAQPGDEVLW